MSSEKKEAFEKCWAELPGKLSPLNDGDQVAISMCLLATAEYLEELTQERDADVLRMQKATETIETLTATCNDLRQKLWDWNGQFETQEARLEAITAERDRLRKLLSSSPKIHLVWKTFPDGTEDIDSAIRQKDIFTSVKAEPGFREEVVYAVRVEGVE